MFFRIRGGKFTSQGTVPTTEHAGYLWAGPWDHEGITVGRDMQPKILFGELDELCRLALSNAVICCVSALMLQSLTARLNARQQHVVDSLTVGQLPLFQLNLDPELEARIDASIARVRDIGIGLGVGIKGDPRR